MDYTNFARDATQPNVLNAIGKARKNTLLRSLSVIVER